MITVVIVACYFFIYAHAAAEEFISGHGFHNMARWNTDTMYRTNLKPNSVLNDGDMIFFRCMPGLKDKWMKQLLRQHNQHQQEQPPVLLGRHDESSHCNTSAITGGSDHKYTIIVHNCDSSFKHTPQQLEVLRPFVRRIYTVNNACGVACFPFVQTIPLGFIDSHLHPDKAHDVFKAVASHSYSKDTKHWVFMNFMLHDHVNKHGQRIPDAKRTPCIERFSDQPWVLYKEAGLAPKETYVLMAKAKYVVSPRGAGTDCHRIYEALYLDAIPIVESHELDHFYRHLPVLIVHTWTDITESYLMAHHDEHKRALDEWKQKYSNWTQPAFWLSGGDKGPFGEL